MKISRGAVRVSLRFPTPEAHGSIAGIETISHLRENGRITIMFTAFDGAPRIVRLFGKGNPPADLRCEHADILRQEPLTSLDQRSTLNSSLLRRGIQVLVR